jgi:hypothetical protein
MNFFGGRGAFTRVAPAADVRGVTRLNRMLVADLPASSAAADSVGFGAGDLDGAIQVFDSIRSEENLRRRRIDQLRSAVRSDAYDNDLKLSIAVDRLLERFDGREAEAGVDDE